MKPVLTFLFYCAMALALTFVLTTAPALPQTVASGYSFDGRPKGFVDRSTYVWMTCGVIVFLAAAVVWIPLWGLKHRKRWFNIPHRDHWLAPERYEASAVIIANHLYALGILVMAFLAYTHGLELLGGRREPGGEPHAALQRGGMVGFVVAIVVWIFTLTRSFRRR